MSIFDEKIEELLRLGRPTIVFGLKEPDREILESLQKVKEYAEIKLVGPIQIKDVQGFDVTVDDQPELRLAKMMANDEAEGAIRGTIDDFLTFEKYEQLTGEKHTVSLGLFEDSLGRQFFLGPASNVEGWSKEERLKIAHCTAEFMESWEIKPRIAVFTGRRHESYERKSKLRDGVDGILNKTYEEAKWIVSELKKKEIKDVKNWAIDLNVAIKEGWNVLIPVNGMIGNQILRMLLVCGGKIVAGTRLGLSRPFAENSRTEKDYLPHVRWLVALINKKKRDNKMQDS